MKRAASVTVPLRFIWCRHTLQNASNLNLVYFIQDLIKFLQSSGPLERSLDKERTSPKVYESLVADEKAKDEQAKKANERVKRRMPIISGDRELNASKLDGLIGGVNAGNAANVANDSKVPIGLGEIEDGSMTTRTTNFSTTDRSNRIENFGVNRRTLYDLSMKLNGIKSDTDKWKQLVGEEFKILVDKEEVSRSEEQMEKDLAMLQDTMRYISVPVLMRDTGDTDGDVIGIPRDRVQDLRLSGLKIAKEKSLQFILLDEDK